MKKILKATIYLSLSVFAFQAYAQTAKSPTFKINGKFNGAASGEIYMLTLNRKVIDSAAIVNGRFVLSGKLDEPGRMLFQIKPGVWYFPALVDAAQINFDIDTTGAMHQYSPTGKHEGQIREIKETGSPLADAYVAYEKATGQDEYFALAGKMGTLSKDSVAIITQKLGAIRNAFIEKGKIWTENYVRQNPASIAGVFIYKEYYSQIPVKSPVDLGLMLTQFSGAARSSSYYQALYNMLPGKGALIGKPAPDFTLLKRDKGKLQFSLTRGSVVMLDFWASWCVPCRAGIPDWKKVYAKYHPKGLQIISISDDRTWGDWVKALDKEKMPWMQVIDEFPKENAPAIVGELYGMYAMPYFVLIDKQGDVIAASGDPDVMTKKMEEVFK